MTAFVIHKYHFNDDFILFIIIKCCMSLKNLFWTNLILTSTSAYSQRFNHSSAHQTTTTQVTRRYCPILFFKYWSNGEMWRRAIWASYWNSYSGYQLYTIYVGLSTQVISTINVIIIIRLRTLIIVGICIIQSNHLFLTIFNFLHFALF